MNKNLKWVSWNGSIPSGAVSIYNAYRKRRDYICHFQCSVGFYTKSQGPSCFYPYDGKEFYNSIFKILINEDNFEILEWKADSWGYVPFNAVDSCGTGTYIGKNKYGLGKIVPNFKSFFLPYDGKEYFYKSYEVLTINLNIIQQTLNNIQYKLNELNMTMQPPEMLTKSTVINKDCRPVKKTINLSKATTVQKTWSVGHTFSSEIATTITASVPMIGEAAIGFSTEISMDWNKGASKEEIKTYQQSVEIEVPPNYVCETFMEGVQVLTDLPFVADLTKHYQDGQKRKITVRGKYKDVQINELTTLVKRCQLIVNAESCLTAALQVNQSNSSLVQKDEDYKYRFQ
ncbi:Hypothetical predicted protein [Pelobates cultripes]|uniref:Uncharacterized protein n=1 Tax=Pelobates cultripes TaxID=61616 RepID=A0AAD1RIA2_PELCU|nr:Hypothetical predicted protein [Pelobates cultripes]